VGGLELTSGGRGCGCVGIGIGLIAPPSLAIRCIEADLDERELSPG
jgi:hypothetical protein